MNSDLLIIAIILVAINIVVLYWIINGFMPFFSNKIFYYREIYKSKKFNNYQKELLKPKEKISNIIYGLFYGMPKFNKNVHKNKDSGFWFLTIFTSIIENRKMTAYMKNKMKPVKILVFETKKPEDRFNWQSNYDYIKVHAIKDSANYLDKLRLKYLVWTKLLIQYLPLFILSIIVILIDIKAIIEPTFTNYDIVYPTLVLSSGTLILSIIYIINAFIELKNIDIVDRNSKLEIINKEIHYSEKTNYRLISNIKSDRYVYNSIVAKEIDNQSELEKDKENFKSRSNNVHKTLQEWNQTLDNNTLLVLNYLGGVNNVINAQIIRSKDKLFSGFLVQFEIEDMKLLKYDNFKTNPFAAEILITHNNVKMFLKTTEFAHHIRFFFFENIYNTVKNDKKVIGQRLMR